jgi:hypothetical protein
MMGRLLAQSLIWKGTLNFSRVVDINPKLFDTDVGRKDPPKGVKKSFWGFIKKIDKYLKK